jgi:putative membrane protein
MGALAPFWPWGPLRDASPAPAAAVLLVVVAIGYGVGVRRLARRGRPWPRSRTVAFGLGLASLAVASQSGIAAASDSWYSAHVVEHLLIGMVGPLLLALGAPVTLVVQAGSRRAQLAVLELLRLPVLRVVRRPLPVLVLFTVTLAAMNMPAVVEAARAHVWLHDLLHLHALVVGLAFAMLVTGADPEAWRVGAPVRVGVSFVTIPAHAFVAMAVLAAGVGLSDAAVLGAARAAHDQSLGASFLWIGGDLIGLVVTLMAALAWARAEHRAGARNDRRLDEAAASQRAAAAVGSRP